MAYAGLNPTIVIRHIRRQLGAIAYDLELSDEEMMQVVFQHTIPTFSKYFPYRFRVMVGPKDEVVAGKACYILPNEDNLEIMGISKVSLGNYYGYNYTSTMTQGFADPYNTQLFNDFVALTQTRVTWHYLAPNHVEIYPRIMDQNKALITVKAIHPKHLRSIKHSLREEFLQLAYLDVLESLYPIRKRFETLNSSYGSIQLFMDSVERAHDNREELLRKFQENVLKDSDAPRVFFG